MEQARLKRGCIQLLSIGTLGLALICSASSFAQEIAHVRSARTLAQSALGDQGNAWLFNRGGVCYALTPLHVLVDPHRGKNDRYARLVVGRLGRTPKEAQGDRCAVFKDRDLVLLRVSGMPDMADCGKTLIGLPNIDDVLGHTSQASLLTTTDSGRFVRSELSIRSASATDADSFWVAPSSAQDRLSEGMSGGLVMIQDAIAGQLIAVDNDKDSPNDGMARVQRMDRVAVWLTRLFVNPDVADVENPSCLRSSSEGELRATELRGDSKAANLADYRCGAKLLSWSAPPVSETSRPENLLGGNQAGRWRVEAVDEVTIDIRLCNAEGGVSSVRFDTSGCQPGDNVGYSVEAIVLNSAHLPTTSLGFAHLQENAAFKISTGVRLLAKELRMRFVPNSSGARAVCVGPLLVK